MKLKLSILMSMLFIFISVSNYLPAKAASLPQLQMVTQPAKEYYPGERVSFSVTSPNYGGKVEYRVILYNGTTKITSELWKTPATGYYYKNWQPSGNYNFTINWPVIGMEPGAYSLTVLVRRVGTKGAYDSFVKTNSFWVKNLVTNSTDSINSNTHNNTETIQPSEKFTFSKYSIYEQKIISTYTIIVSEVKNNTDKAYRKCKVNVMLFDSKGKFIMSNEEIINPELKPGDIYSFKIQIPYQNDIADVKFTFYGDEIENHSDIGLITKQIGITGGESGYLNDWLYVSALIECTAKHDVISMYTQATLYDKDNNIINSEFKFIDEINNLSIGDITSVKFTFDDMPLNIVEKVDHAIVRYFSFKL